MGTERTPSPLPEVPKIPYGQRGIVVGERDDPELTAIAACVTALRDLDPNAAARVAHYVVERHPFVRYDGDAC